MPWFRVEVHRLEHHRAEVMVEADSAEAAEEQVIEDGVDSDRFDIVSATEDVFSVAEMTEDEAKEASA